MNHVPHFIEARLQVTKVTDDGYISDGILKVRWKRIRVIFWMP